jgi:hypothetical protein
MNLLLLALVELAADFVLVEPVKLLMLLTHLP